MSRAENREGTGHRIKLFGSAEAEQLIRRARGIRERAEELKIVRTPQAGGAGRRPGEDRMKMWGEAEGESGCVKTPPRQSGPGLNRQSQYAQDVRAAAQA